LHGVQGVECSNHSVPTKKPQEIQSLSGDWIFLCLMVFEGFQFLPHFFAPLFAPPGIFAVI